jgi:hypothetical protein
MLAGPRRRRARALPGYAVPPHRRFDPRLVGGLECEAWVAYYRREWPRVLRRALSLTRHTFGLSPLATLRGSWYVLRANQLWAPADNDPQGARATMERFYRLLAARHPQEGFDPAHAATLEVEWWRLHRAHQHGDAAIRAGLVEALATLYAYVYRAPQDAVRPAAEQRVVAMDLSDRWVEQGCRLPSPLVEQERAALVRSYAALLAAVHSVSGI